MTIEIVREEISYRQLHKLAGETYGGMIKAVADLKRGLIAFGGQMHTDAQAALLADGSNAADLWGFCLHFDRPFADAFEFRSHINIRPADGNPSIQINDEKLRRAIVGLAGERVSGTD